ncbi:putative Mg2+ transporter-C (MgtC) family protein [Pelosinus fermentans]|uniref:MgtC/SapB family protein n=1 Tax=Pelosinus fermentans TaxID=365349 RepID=UPI0002686197|nr:MgtC/SapB family protein [Pelosinus fermentans]OAM92973.1 MgtC/SapB transporter [Pelosinus fermentans DSM 17108]SDQ62757.1 putative Mg2+ transporter-C (MgtC) family protein [Pelosinus fermentans]
MVLEWEMAIRLLLASFLGGFIGYERESHHKAAGLRTHILVSIGSCLIMILSIKIYASVQGYTNADPTRLAAQVVSGIGFLGAGSIMKEGSTVRGLTTAASLWVVSGVGLAVGSGYYMGAFMTTAFVFLTLSILSRIEKKDHYSLVELAITTIDTPGQIGKIASILGVYGIQIRNVDVREQKELLKIVFTVYIPKKAERNQVTVGLLNISGITNVAFDAQ